MIRRFAAARRAWRRLPKVLGRLGVIEGITINDDFTDRTSDVPALLAARAPIWVGVQEGVQTRYRQLLSRLLGRLRRLRWGVRQRTTTEATQGVAVIWDRYWCRAIRRHRDKPHRLGYGWQPLADSPQTRIRGVIWQDLAVRIQLLGRRLRVRIASTHRFPPRERDQWLAFDHALANWLLASPLPVVLFMDANERGGASALLQLLEKAAPGRFRWVGDGIDGAITDLPTAAAATALARRASDHRPVSIPFDLTAYPRNRSRKEHPMNPNNHPGRHAALAAELTTARAVATADLAGDGPAHGLRVVAVAPTQVRRPWRSVTRTVFQTFVALAAMWGLIVAALGLPDWAWVSASLAVAGAITRVMALPQVETFLRMFLPWLAAAPAPRTE